MNNGRTQFEVEVTPSPYTIQQFVSIVREYSGEYFTEDFADSVAIDAEYQRLSILKRDSELLSCIMFTCLDGCPHITAMATKRIYKNKGYGKQLMEQFVNYAAQLGFRCIELYAWSEKTKPICSSTQSFYKTAGFTVTSEHADLWEKGMITVKMRKNLE